MTPFGSTSLDGYPVAPKSAAGVVGVKGAAGVKSAAGGNKNGELTKVITKWASGVTDQCQITDNKKTRII